MKPILFQAAMVRAILDGRKTQTRRIMKKLECPYGLPGEKLWVKETHLPKASGTIYHADFDPVEAAGIGALYGGWKPSIFCKRSDSRITLEITTVRCERLNDINEEDAIAEGLYPNPQYPHRNIFTWDGVQGNSDNPVYSYQLLWESINGNGSWKLNPRVWILCFKKI